ncbi:MAG TPA: nicotinamide-nucleotide amidohydrolase family protein [Bacteroidia bacterium]|jgi:nicotinamide-nucleotide amidase
MDRRINSFVKTLQEKELTVAFAESVTCGMVAHKLATCIGTSDVLKGSIVCYSSEVKSALMKIPKKAIIKHSAESKEVTDLLAKKLQRLIKADIHAALTGLASEGGSENKQKPPGTVFMSVIYKKKLYSKRRLFKGSPLQIRRKACMAIFEMILLII